MAPCSDRVPVRVSSSSAARLSPFLAAASMHSDASELCESPGCRCFWLRACGGRGYPGCGLVLDSFSVPRGFSVQLARTAHLACLQFQLAGDHLHLCSLSLRRDQNHAGKGTAYAQVPTIPPHSAPAPDLCDSNRLNHHQGRYWTITKQQRGTLQVASTQPYAPNATKLWLLCLQPF